MKRQYPRLTATLVRDKNTQEKCKCGEVGKFKIEVQVNYFRGDDEYYWCCEKHKKDIEFLLGDSNE